MFQHYNLRGTPTPGFETVGLDFNMDALSLLRLSDGHHDERYGPFILNGGINGGYKDQETPFNPSVEVTFFAISGPAGLRTLSSLAVPLSGPAMPDGYDHFVPLATIVLRADGTLPEIQVDGNHVTYPNEEFVLDPTISPYLGQATKETFFSLAPWVPAKAVRFTIFIDAQVVSNDGFGGMSSCIIKCKAARNFQNQTVFSPPVKNVHGIAYPSAGSSDAPCTMPNRYRGFWYQWYDGQEFFVPTSIQWRWLSVYVQGYELP